MQKNLKIFFVIAMILVLLITSLAFAYTYTNQNNALDDSLASSEKIFNCENQNIAKIYHNFEDPIQLNDFYAWGANVKFVDYRKDSDNELRLKFGPDSYYTNIQSRHTFNSDFRVLLNIENMNVDPAYTQKAGLILMFENGYELHFEKVKKGTSNKLVIDKASEILKSLDLTGDKDLVLAIERQAGKLKFYYKYSPNPTSSKNMISNITNGNPSNSLESFGMNLFYNQLSNDMPVNWLSVWFNSDAPLSTAPSSSPTSLTLNVDIDDMGIVYCKPPVIENPVCQNDSDCEAGYICQTEDNTCQPDPIPLQPVRILTINYNPKDPTTRQTAADKYFSNIYNGQSAIEFTQSHLLEFKDILSEVSNNTYTFDIVKDITIDTFPITYDGFQFDLDSYAICVYGNPEFDETSCKQIQANFNYLEWERNNNICQILEENNIDMVWMYSLPYIMIWESFIFGPTDQPQTNGASYIPLGCTKKHVTFIDGTYDVPFQITHSFGHHVENILYQVGDTMSFNDRDKYIYNFLNISASEEITCGSVHTPFNTREGYDMANMTLARHNCATWKNFPNITTDILSEPLNCTAWNCDLVNGVRNDLNWQRYWLKYLPSNPGSSTLRGISGTLYDISNNWWDYVFETDNIIRLKRDARL